MLVYNSILRLKINEDGTKSIVNITKEYPKFPFIAGHFFIKIEHCIVETVILPRIENLTYPIGLPLNHFSRSGFTFIRDCEYIREYTSFVRFFDQKT